LAHKLLNFPPMKAPRRFALTSIALAAPAALLAHPGHDGDHDFTWDFSHLVAHPVATLLCAAVLGTAIYAIVRALRSPDTKRK
jgi:hypothetical protein